MSFLLSLYKKNPAEAKHWQKWNSSMAEKEKKKKRKKEKGSKQTRALTVCWVALFPSHHHLSQHHHQRHHQSPWSHQNHSWWWSCWMAQMAGRQKKHPKVKHLQFPNLSKFWDMCIRSWSAFNTDLVTAHFPHINTTWFKQRTEQKCCPTSSNVLSSMLKVVCI